MELTLSEKGKCLVVAVGGEIDDHYTSANRSKIDSRYAKSGCRDMLIDFSKATFMDSSGIGMVIGRYKNVKERGGKMYATGMSRNMIKIFDMAGLRQIIQPVRNIQEIEGGL